MHANEAVDIAVLRILNLYVFVLMGSQKSCIYHGAAPKSNRRRKKILIGAGAAFATVDQDLGLDGILTEEREDAIRKMIIVGLWCIQMNPLNRPSVSEVLGMLEGSVEVLVIPPKPFLSSPRNLQNPSTSSSTFSIS
ncbi:hypothetical protein C5167_024059 [Papaver somniferum]|uniref:Uncharacterized protein n=1 Tax=Papaver somniferum TaxID=3469 RepID=A0A4Y7JRI5_PAPSO|nr:hypothetical protein C5167_024059 [Papaver somniferum]